MTGAVHVHEHRVMKKVYGPLRLSPAAMLQASTCMLGIVVLAALLVNKGALSSVRIIFCSVRTLNVAANDLSLFSSWHGDDVCSPL